MRGRETPAVAIKKYAYEEGPHEQCCDSDHPLLVEEVAPVAARSAKYLNRVAPEV